MKVRCRNMHKSLIGLCFVALLAGCSGNTYGTGVSSEKQLADDIGHMLTLNLTKERKNIKEDKWNELREFIRLTADKSPKC